MRKIIKDLSGTGRNEHVDVSYLHLKHLPDFLLGVKVRLMFDCRYNDLTSLKNSPDINDDTCFYCAHNKLTNLIGVSLDFGKKCAFDCNNNELTSLKGAPPDLFAFNCSSNKLTSLKYAPSTVKYFSCQHNHLPSLTGGPTEVGGTYMCHGNRLDSLEGAPITVGHDFYCINNPLTSLKGIPKFIGRDLYFPANLRGEFPEEYIRSLSKIDGNVIYSS